MSSREEILKSLFNFKNSEYYKLDGSFLTEIESQLLDSFYIGIIINGPRQINSKEYDNLPILTALCYSGERGWTINLKKNCFLVVTNLFAGDVFVSSAFKSKKKEFHSSNDDNTDGTIPPGLPDAAAVVSIINAKEKAPLQWDTGKWAFTLLYFDWVSNNITIDFIGDQPISLSFAPSVNPLPNLDHITELPSYVRIKQSPELINPGLSFMLEIKIKNEKHILNLYATYTIKTRAYHIQEIPEVYEFKNGHKEEVAAIIPITVLLLSKNIRLPLKIDLLVPVYGMPKKADEEVQGYCALDILEVAGIQELKPEEYVCYIMLDGVAYGPQKINIRE